MKEDATTGEQQIESLGMDLSSTLQTVSIHRSQATPGTPIKRAQFLRKRNYLLPKNRQR
jgi:hypothetical protein